MKRTTTALLLLLFFVAVILNSQQSKHLRELNSYHHQLDSIQTEYDSLLVIHLDMCSVLNDLPLERPLEIVEVNSKFGYRKMFGRTQFHAGIDLSGNYRDTVFATANGMVEKARWNGGYGRCVIIKHKDGFQTLYGHLSKIYVAVGDSVIVGQAIGRVGSTGRSTGAHLHYEVLHDGNAIDPCNFIPFLENTQCE